MGLKERIIQLEEGNWQVSNELQRKKTETICEVVERAANIIPNVWPIQNFIATNPLKDLESLRFDHAFTYASTYYDSLRPLDSLTREVNIALIKWCQTYLAQGQATIPMPCADENFYKAWCGIARFDRRLHHNSIQARNWLATLPETADQAIEFVLDKLNISIADQEEYLRQQLVELPGWAGFAKWSESSDQYKISLLDFLAVRLSILWSLKEVDYLNPPKSNQFLKRPRDSMFIQKLKDCEDQYLQALLGKFKNRSLREPLALQTKAQFIFCIDVRSEPIRREIESIGGYETFGAAGFFGLPIAVKPYGSDAFLTACPAIVKPQYKVQEKIIGTNRTKHHLLFQMRRKLKEVYQIMKYSFVSPFTLVETLGLWCGIRMVVNLVTPYLLKKIHRCYQRQFEAVKHPNLDTVDYPIHARTDHAETFLCSIGLSKHFSKHIFVCGHTSQTENNPYAAALKCGACSGNGGGTNAQTIVAILNDKTVREELKSRGINIPQDTRFIACEHNTTTDQFTYFLEQDEKTLELQTIIEHLEQACSENRIKRLKQLGVKTTAKTSMRKASLRGQKWSETRPEWGLAKNASFIIGPRKLTVGIDLMGRSFLHSYDWDQDPTDKILEAILMGPMVVAEWINMQYFFSTLDPLAFGSGSKVTHNVVGKIGVMQGNGSDLMFGLPLQSVHVNDHTPYHELQRLITIIYSPPSKISRILEKQQVLRKLFLNQWVRLVAIDPETTQSYELNERGGWDKVLLD